MSDDLDLMERFELLATADFGPAASTAALRGRVAQRRRRRRVVAGSALGVVVILALVGALTARGGAPADDLRTVAPAPSGRKVPASYGTGPRLVVGAVPTDLSSTGCGRQFGEEELASCTFAIPADPERSGLVLLLKPAPAAARQAWVAGDAAAAAAAIEQPSGSPTFIQLGGRRVLSMGANGPDSEAYAVLLGSHFVFIGNQGASDGQLATIVGGLATEPVDLGFTIPVSALPSGAHALAEGQRRRWFTPDTQAPERSYETGGRVAGISYEVPGVVSDLEVDVVRDVDAESYVETWAEQIQRAEGLDASPIEANGRAGMRVRARFAGVAGETGAVQDRLAVVVDPDTVILVEGSVDLADDLLGIAGRTTVSPVDPFANAASKGEGSAEATGWYLPSGLPDGWTVDRGVAQATDGSGEAQLWLTSPTGNLFIVTLAVPRDGPDHTDRAKRHPVRGVDEPVWAEPVDDAGDGLPYRRLRTSRPGAAIDLVLLGTPHGEKPTAQGFDESDELIASLVPATTDEWRRALRDIPAPPSLLGASTLEALPDAT